MDTDLSVDRLWRIADVAHYLSISINSVYKLTAPKAHVRLPHIRLAGRLRFRKKDVDAWLDLCSTSDLAALRRIRGNAERR